MTFFESLLVLLLAAVVLLQISRRLLLPYPAMLAAAGVLVAFLPGTPNVSFEPRTALALFVAPIIVDAAYDFPSGAALRFFVPLLTLAGFAVLVTTAAVALLGYRVLGLPVYAAVALGAIVAPPDAAAATAVLNSVSVPRSLEEVLRGESLFNDATALLLFSGALAVQTHGSLTLPYSLRLLAAVPGGLLLGILWAYVVRYTNRFSRDTLGGNLFQFVNTYLAWVVADRLGLSAVLCLVAMAMTLARFPEITNYPRVRIQSFAVWSAVVFTLNVIAFLLMGMQARHIVTQMQGPRLRQALTFAALVVITVILARLLVAILFNALSAGWARYRGLPRPPGLRRALFIGWSGMRGFVTLATAFALPAAFPQRDAVVLTAFAVVLGTLVFQGLTLRPVIRLLRLDDAGTTLQELGNAREALAGAALRSLEGKSGSAADNLRFHYTLDRHGARQLEETPDIILRRNLGLAAVAAEREQLDALRSGNHIGITGYGQLQEELDWRELTLLRDEERHIAES